MDGCRRGRSVRGAAGKLIEAVPTPAPGPLGSIAADGAAYLQTTNLRNVLIEDGAGGDDDILLLYDSYVCNAALLHVDVSAGTAQVKDMGTSARIAPGSTWAKLDGWLYFGTTTPDGVWRYAPATNTLERLDAGDMVDKAYIACITPDGLLWWGGDGGYHYSYDPAGAGTFTIHGPITRSDATTPYTCYRIIASATHVYFGLSYQWELAIYNRSTEAVTLVWEGAGNTNVALYTTPDQARNFVRRTDAASAITWFELDGATLTPIDAGDVPALLNEYDPGWALHRVVADQYAIDVTAAVPATGQTDVSVTYDPGGGDVTISGISGVPIGDQLIARATALDASTCAVMSSTYGPVFTVNPTTRAATLQGWTGLSTRHIFKASSGLVYMTYYTDLLAQWDTTAAWTMTPDGGDWDSTNPVQAVADGRVLEYMTEDSAGNIWASAQETRTGVGGTLYRYTPATTAVASWRAELGLDLRYIYGLCAVGDYVVYSSVLVAGGTPTITVLNQSGEVVYTHAAPSGDPGFLIALSTTDVFAIHEAGWYRMDVTTGTVTYTRAETDVESWAAYYWQRHATLGDDGKIWLHIGAKLYRVDPLNGVPVWISNNAAPGEVIWLNATPYVIGYYTLRKVTL